MHGEPAESGTRKGAPRDHSCQTGVGTAPAGLLQSSRGSEHPLSNCLELGQWGGWAKTLLVMAWGSPSISASVSPPGVMRVWLRCTGVSPSGPAHHGPPFLLPWCARDIPGGRPSCSWSPRATQLNWTWARRCVEGSACGHLVRTEQGVGVVSTQASCQPGPVPEVLSEGTAVTWPQGALDGPAK